MKKLEKCEDIAESLQPHRFPLVEDEFLQEVKISRRIIKINSVSDIRSSRLKTVPKFKKTKLFKNEISSSLKIKKGLPATPGIRRSSRRKVLEAPCHGPAPVQAEDEDQVEQGEGEGPGLVSSTPDVSSSSPSQVRVSCQCEGCLTTNCGTCKSCKKISKLRVATATRELRCEARTCWGFSVPRLPLKMCQVRLERLTDLPALSYNHRESDDQEEDSLEDFVEIVEDKVVPMDEADRAMFYGLESDLDLGSDEEILSTEFIKQPSIAALQPPSPQIPMPETRSDGQVDIIINLAIFFLFLSRFLMQDFGQ